MQSKSPTKMEQGHNYTKMAKKLKEKDDFSRIIRNSLVGKYSDFGNTQKTLFS